MSADSPSLTDLMAFPTEKYPLWLYITYVSLYTNMFNKDAHAKRIILSIQLCYQVSQRLHTKDHIPYYIQKNCINLFSKAFCRVNLLKDQVTESRILFWKFCTFLWTTFASKESNDQRFLWSLMSLLACERDAVIHFYQSGILFQISHVLMEAVSPLHVEKPD